MSDNNDTQSKRLGARLLQELGVPSRQAGPADPGSDLEKRVIEALVEVRPDLTIERSRPATDFNQYAHLRVFPEFFKRYRESQKAVPILFKAIDDLPDGEAKSRLQAVAADATEALTTAENLVQALQREVPQESLLKVDVSVGTAEESGPAELAVALSSKWSLRTDRAQDCVSQGNKLVAQRRGRMPHFAVITIEPRPSMLKILADGSGAVDCVYHLDLPALERTIREEAKSSRSPETWSPLLTFERIVGQRRLRNFDDLIRHVQRLPSPRTD